MRIAKSARLSLWLGLFIAGLLVQSGCAIKDKSDGDNGKKSSSGEGAELSGVVKIDGSSTVFPISQAVAEEFQKVHQRVRVTVGTSGTGGGFKKFVKGETDINDASRPIKQKEIDACRKNGIEYIELKIAIDGLSVLVNPKNDFCETLTVDQLKKIWEPGSKVKTWKDVNSNWPAEEIKLFGPDTDSGTFDYFTEVVCGKSGKSRSDYAASTDDNVLVNGISGETFALGYFGYAYYVENKDKLRAVGVSPDSNPAHAVKPTNETIEGGNYIPLSRPLFLYVNKNSLEKPQVQEFLKYYIGESDGQNLVSEVGYVRLSATELKKTITKMNHSLNR